MSQVDRQTDRQSVPQDYLSIRVTCPKCDHRRVLAKVCDEIDYVAYPHKGKKTGKEHFHLFVPQVSKKNMIRERLRSMGFEGNGQVCIKIMHNGLDHGIQYGSKEGTTPYIQGDLQAIVDMSPAWEDGKVQSDIRRYREQKPWTDRYWMLTRANVCLYAYRYKQDNNLQTNRLKEVLLHMFKNTKWRIDLSLLRALKRKEDNVGFFLQNEFEVQLGISDPVLDWSDEFVASHDFRI